MVEEVLNKDIILGLISLLFIISGCTIQQAYNVNYILNHKEEFESNKIKVIGKIKLLNIKCTAMACTEENPCCNSCGGDLKLADLKDPTIYLELNGKYKGKRVRYEGTNCDVKGYPLNQDEIYIVEGIFYKNKYDYFVLNLTDFSLVEDE